MPAQNRLRRAAPLILVVVLIVQTVTHLAWLSISAHSGQLTVPYLMSRGMTLFGNVIEIRAPANPTLLALLYRLLPSVEPVLILQVMNLLLVMGLTLLIYALAKRLTGSTFVGICAMLFWAAWEPVYGNVLFYFDSLDGAVYALVVLVWLITEKRQPGWLAPFLCGLLLGGATLLKQPAWVNVILFTLWLLVFSHRGRQLPALIFGVLIIPLTAVAITSAQGSLDMYLYWNFAFHLGGTERWGQPLTGDFFRKVLLTNVLAPAFALLAVGRSDDRRAVWLLIVALWIGAGAALYPSFGEDYAMAHLPLLAVMSGIVIDILLQRLARLRWRSATTDQLIAIGVALAIGAGWCWAVAVTYIPNALGRASVPAYDEFKPLAQRVLSLSAPDDTLYVLPEWDGNSQLHVLTGLMPPGTWVNGHSAILAAPGIVDQLLAEWAQTPPTILVDFPDFPSSAGLQRLRDFIDRRYSEVGRIDDVPFNGDAVIYRLNSASSGSSRSARRS
ncbi:MAG: hypothetical protein IT319_06230 [Anaerolineae bacterium]|nr:hypothetical protein [Anaerolineae bacterium]